MQEGAFENGVQHGHWMRYYENGHPLDEGEYVLGTKVGEWKTFDKDGSLKATKTFSG